VLILKGAVMVWFKGLQAAKDKNDDFKFFDELGLILSVSYSKATFVMTSSSEMS
jgi:hypothetical protein